MATTATVRPPVDGELFIKEARNSRPWLNFFRQLARLFTAMRNVATALITTTDLAAQGASVATITQNPIANSYTAAGASYAQATAQTWVNGLTELKSDVNTLSVEVEALRAEHAALTTKYDLNVALTNELKAKLNSLLTALNAE